MPLSETRVHRPIKFLALERDFSELREEYTRAWQDTLASGQVVGGPQVEQFEQRIATLTGRAHAISVSSGTDALRIALAAAGVNEHFTVLVPSLSFIASASAVAHVGATLAFVDIDAHHHLDLERAARALPTHGKRAMIVVGLYGNGLDARAIIEFCERHDVLLIEDAAQSFSSLHAGGIGGGLGRVSSLSFAPTKNIPCFGNAGAITTDDAQLAARARLMRVHGKRNNREPAQMLGQNAVLASTHAAQLNVSLDHHEARSARRDAIARRYLQRLIDIRHISVPPEREGTRHNWHKFVITTHARDALQAHLAASGIETQIHYATPLPDESIFHPATHAATNTPSPRAQLHSQCCLTLPLHPHLQDDEVDFIIDSIERFPTNAH